MTQPAADPTILSANISEVRAGLDMSPSNGSFVASLATLTLAAAVLGAGALGDLYGMRRMFTVGLFGAIGFGLLAAAAPNSAVLIGARAGVGIAFAFLLGLSLAITTAVFPPHRRAAAIAMYLGAGYALTTPMPALGSLLAEHIGWRSGFLVAPVAGPCPDIAATQDRRRVTRRGLRKRGRFHRSPWHARGHVRPR